MALHFSTVRDTQKEFAAFLDKSGAFEQTQITVIFRTLKDAFDVTYSAGEELLKSFQQIEVCFEEERKRKREKREKRKRKRNQKSYLLGNCRNF